MVKKVSESFISIGIGHDVLIVYCFSFNSAECVSVISHSVLTYFISVLSIKRTDIYSIYFGLLLLLLLLLFIFDPT